MAADVQPLAQRARAWARRAAAAGWLSGAQVRRLDALEVRLPDDLFEIPDDRPLVVAFVGGTGVGKSSLLNRVAGRALARVGVERPTSREVTLYLHVRCPLAALPQPLADAPVVVRRHEDDRWRHVAWIDTPDLDSTCAEHRAQVLRWLGCVDLVVYVVSPERYRDDAGWRVVMSHRGESGWLFVINRWDEGAAPQREDFAGLLREAGFDDPVVLCTSCLAQPPALPSVDEFAQLTALIEALLERHAVRALGRYKQRARLRALRDAVRGLLDALPDETRAAALRRLVAENWKQTANEIRTGLAWPIALAAERVAAQHRSAQAPWQRLRSAAAGEAGKQAGVAAPPADDAGAGPQLDAIAAGLWDGWVCQRLAEWLDRIEVRVAADGMRPQALRAALEDAVRRAPALARPLLATTLRETLARPASRWQCLARRVTGFLMVVLPGAAILWVAAMVVRGYLRASLGQGTFLGIPFAVHSLLLVALAWFVPWWIDRRLKPDVEQAARRGLQRGLEAALEAVGTVCGRSADAALEQGRRLRAEGRQLVAELSRATLEAQPIDDALLRRVTASELRPATPRSEPA